MGKQVKKRFDIIVEQAGLNVSKTFELDKTISTVLGVLLTSDRDDLLYYRGSQKLEINKDECFPENYESKLLMTGINLAPKSRYYDLGRMPAGSGSVRVSYKDTDSKMANFELYRVSIYLLCELED